MKSISLLFFCFLLTALPLFTSAQSCCQISQENGRIAYDKGDFEAAFREWSEGLTSPDADQCPELAALVAKVQDKLSHSLVDQKKQEGPNEISDSAGVAAKKSPDPMSRPPDLSNRHTAANSKCLRASF
ncbi:MAG: hypothetical protein HUU01_18880 [Saprospiraceae bacterium]|nr:hypothetical protein [Saprospiraceae bacterium]